MSEATDALPPGWAACELEAVRAPEPGSFVDGPFGSNLKTEHYTAAGPRVIRLENVGDGLFRDAETHISPEHFDRLSRHEARARDVVIALLGDKVPRACVVPAQVGKAIVKADCPRLRPDPRVAVPEFVAYALNSEQVRGQAKALVHGVGRPRLKLSELRGLTIPLPPLAEQRRIVEALETHFTRLDAAVATLERVRANLKRYRAAVLQAAVEGRLTSSERRDPDGGPWGAAALPLTWRWAAAGDLSEPLGRGITPPGPEITDDRGDVPFIKVMNLTADGRLDVTARHFHIPRTRHLRMARSAARPGDVLMSIVGPPLGKAAVVPQSLPECNINQAIVRFRAREVVLPEYLCIVLLSPRAIAWTEGRGSATAGQTNLNLTTCRELPVPLPPMGEQRRIVEMVTRVLSIADASNKALQVDLARCARLRQSLLRLAFDGRLVPQDPGDEPASVLLDRIRRERADRATSGPPTRANPRRGPAPRRSGKLPAS